MTENGQNLGLAGQRGLSPLVDGLEGEKAPNREIDPILGQRLSALLFLASPALPTGAFAWSNGLEALAAAKLVTNPRELTESLEVNLAGGLATFDLPLLRKAYAAAQREDEKELMAVNNWVLAGRETREFLLAERVMGRAVSRLIKSLGPPAFWGGGDLGYVAAYALLGTVINKNLEFNDLGRAYVYGFLENQLAAATRVTLLGQTDSRKIILALGPKVEAALARAARLEDGAIGSTLMGLAICGSNHETLATRLFRS
ncbi:MAG: urease accessory protein UreF [Deltaproteobacteria bacterium]|jgi:urease accessory protein|nr:urease accessory protein UreF [Deltaproteobacteria bacterium]